MHSILHKPHSIASLKCHDGQIVTDSLIKATMFNKKFSSVFTVDNNFTPITHHPPLLACSLSTIHFPLQQFFTKLIN